MKLSNWIGENKIIAIIAFTCIIIFLLIIIFTPPATGYELSIYNAYPWYFWLFLLITIFLGQLIILKYVFYRLLEKKDTSWLLGIVIFLIPIIILLCLPIIRGYPTYGFGDHLTHIGDVKDIIQYGAVGKNNFYPNLHILTASLTLTTGSDTINIVNFLSRFFFIFPFIFIYLFCGIMFNNKNKTLFAFILTSTLLFFGSYTKYIAPYNQSFLLTLIILYLYLKRGTTKNSISFSLLFIILTISYTFYHPINNLFLIIVFISFTITFYFYPKINQITLINSEKKLNEKSLNIILLSVLIFCVWYFSFASIVGGFIQVFRSIFYGASESFFQTQATMLATYKPALFDTLKTILFVYGMLFIVGFLSIFSLIYGYMKWRRNKQKYRLSIWFIFSGISFLIFSILLAGAFFANFIVSWARFFVWAMIFSIILITLVFYSLLSNSKYDKNHIKSIKKLVLTVIVSVFLISLTFLTVFTLYNSPLTNDQNLQVTKMDWEGVEWILDHNNKQITIKDLGITHWRYSHAIYGINKTKSIENFSTIIKPIPDHFSYDTKTSLGDFYHVSNKTIDMIITWLEKIRYSGSYPEKSMIFRWLEKIRYRESYPEVYMIITRLVKILYPEAFPKYRQLWRFTPEDFNQLQDDNSVNRIFSNGDFEAYLIRPNKI